ncbi:MAG: PspC domain-containing protein [Chloroflexaceae bacterium]
MQPRLRRSATESMVAGVCGGLAEYFNIDPVIVRLIFVVVTLTSGLGLPAYLILWVVMPRAPSTGAQQPVDRRARRASQAATTAVAREDPERQTVHARSRSGVEIGGAPVEDREPLTGQPVGAEEPTRGAEPAPPPETPVQPERRNTRWRTLGAILIGIGGVVLLDQFGIDTSFLFPALLIVAGAILLQRQR